MYVYVQYIYANKFCYGFNIRQKLETSPHEKQNETTIDDFKNFTYSSNFKALFGKKLSFLEHWFGKFLMDLLNKINVDCSFFYLEPKF